MSSGTKVHSDCVKVYQELKMYKKHRYVIYSMTDNFDMINVHKTADPSAEYSDFLEDMTEAEKGGNCRFAVYDLAYTDNTNQPKNKILFFMWNPENAIARQKMVYSASAGILKKTLGEGIAKEVQANDHEDLKYDNIRHIIDRL